MKFICQALNTSGWIDVGGTGSGESSALPIWSNERLGGEVLVWFGTVSTYGFFLGKINFRGLAVINNGICWQCCIGTSFTSLTSFSASNSTCDSRFWFSMEITVSAAPAGNSFDGVEGVIFGEIWVSFGAIVANFGAIGLWLNVTFFLPLGGVFFFVFEKLGITFAGSETIFVGYDLVAIIVVASGLDGFNGDGRTSFPWNMAIQGLKIADP